MVCHNGLCVLNRQSSTHHTMRMDLLGDNFFDAPLNRYGRLREPEGDSVEHGLGALAQGRLVQLPDRIWSLGDDDIGASLGRR
jgi:hypothetical protein